MTKITEFGQMDRRGFLGAASAGGLALGGVGLTRPAHADAKADLEALIKAAKAEGDMTMYSAATENVSKRCVDVFNSKYGMKARFLRLSSAPLQQRVSAEATAGNMASDLVVCGGNNVMFSRDGIAKGWFIPLKDAKIPVLDSGEFPKRFSDGNYAIIQIAPWFLAYNKDMLKAADAPKDWPDLLSPKFAGKILIPDPRASDAYIDFWATMHDRYGDSFFEKIRALNPRHYQSGVPATQALGAGEGSAQLPVVSGQVTASIDKGAPLAIQQMQYTTGVEMGLMMPNPTKVKNPNSARLMANFLLSPDGNKLFNDDPGTVSVYDTAGLPKEYVFTKPETLARRDQLAKLLGF